jgi:hypothetical protein
MSNVMCVPAAPTIKLTQLDYNNYLDLPTMLRPMLKTRLEGKQSGNFSQIEKCSVQWEIE